MPVSSSQHPVPPLYPLASASPVTAEAVDGGSPPSSSVPVTMAYAEALVTPTPGSSRPMRPFSGMFGGSQTLPRAEVNPSVVLVGTSRSPSSETAQSLREEGLTRPAEVSAPVPASSTRPASLPSPDRVIPPHRVKGAEDCLKCRASFGPFKRRHHVCFPPSQHVVHHLCSAGAAERSSASGAPPSDASRPSP